jgi:hypothetical protein
MKQKLTEKERMLLYLNNKKFYDRLIAESMTMQPRFLENIEELNKVFPEFYTNSLVKTFEMFGNSLYYSQSLESQAEVADESIHNTKKLVEFFDESFE